MEITTTTTGRVRWAFNFEQWIPTEEDWQKALSLIAPEEQTRILRFKRPLSSGPLVGKDNPDAKSSLIGRLLLLKLVHTQLGIPYKEISLKRTKEGKPYLENPVTQFPNFNFNVSHAGDFVVVGSEPRWIIGVDVMEVSLRRSESVHHFFENMRRCFTPKEWSTIEGGVNDQAKLTQFFNHWTLKESYIKAVGIGLGFELQRAEFTLATPALSATIAIDGVPRSDWQFEIHPDMDGGKHITAVAYGPPDQSTPNYKNVIKWQAGGGDLNVERMEFRILSFTEVMEGFY